MSDDTAPGPTRSGLVLAALILVAAVALDRYHEEDTAPGGVGAPMADTAARTGPAG